MATGPINAGAAENHMGDFFGYPKPGVRPTVALPERQKKVFFSEEKNQKTFVPALISAGVLLAGTHGDIGFGQKFFGSFFQKRTFACLLVQWLNVSAGWLSTR